MAEADKADDGRWGVEYEAPDVGVKAEGRTEGTFALFEVFERREGTGLVDRDLEGLDGVVSPSRLAMRVYLSAYCLRASQAVHVQSSQIGHVSLPLANPHAAFRCSFIRRAGTSRSPIDPIQCVDLLLSLNLLP